MRGLDGKNVIVTGGAGAIGWRDLPALRRATAPRVGVFDRNFDGAKKIAGEIKGFRLPPGSDITDYKASPRAIAAFEKQVGPTDVLVNNAGWDQFVPFVDTTPDSGTR